VSSVFFRKGDRGPAVAEIRARLARLGVLSGSRHVRAEQSLRTLMYPADGGPDDTDPSQWETTALASGEFDEEVDEAVRLFQRERGITVDGIVGPETFRRLEEARWRLGDRVLSYQPGHPFVGEDRLELQRQLNRMGFDSGKEDSHLGPLTDRGLREFQRNTGLQVDGVAGPETLRALGRLHRTVGVESAHLAKERYTLPTLQTGIVGKVVALDASPGSTDDQAPLSGNGATVVTSAIAATARDLLSARGAIASLTPATDAEGGAVAEAERARVANDADCDLVVSVQVDSGDAAAPPLAVYFYGRSEKAFSAAGRSAAEAIGGSLAGAGLGTACTVDARTWDILRATRMPSVRVCFGHTYQAEHRDRLTDPEFQRTIATAITDGLVGFFAPPEPLEP
jgi:N-acetylmuramoyl-L-alanine amidase